MLLTSLRDTFRRAGIAYGFWGRMTPAERRAEWANFQNMRNELQRRFNASSAATQARHQARMNTIASEPAP